MRAVIIGSGAIGGLTAAFTTKGGADVTLLCHHRGTAKAIREEGLRISGMRGNICHKMPAISDFSQLRGQYDQILLATKAYDMEEAARSALPYLKEDGLMTTMQNGMCLDALEDIVGPDRAAACIVSWSCTRVDDAELKFTGEGRFLIGRKNGEKDARIGELRNLLKYAAPVRLSDDIYADLYSKLIVNSCITSTGVLTGQMLGAMLRSPAVRQLFTDVMREDMALADAMHLQVPPFEGRLNYYKLAGRGIKSAVTRATAMNVMRMQYRHLTSSSLTSVRNGRLSEVDYLNGWICRKGDALGVDTPVNDAIVRMVKEIEAGQREMTMSNISELIYNI